MSCSQLPRFYPHAYKQRESDSDETKGKQERQHWRQTLETMRKALTKAASQIDFTAFPTSKMAEEDFKISVTEEGCGSELRVFVSSIS